MRIATPTARWIGALALVSSLWSACAAAAARAAVPVVAREVAAAEAPARDAYDRQVGPVTVLITLPAGEVAPTDFGARVEALRRTDASVLLLAAQPGSKPIGFESLAIVTFATVAAFDAWFSGEGRSLGRALRVRRADVLARDGLVGAPAAGAFFAVNRYASHVSPDEYRTYTRQYVVPNMAHQKAVGALVAYTMYFEREPGGARRTAVLLKQYRSAAEQARGEVEKERYKQAVLLKRPLWKRIHERKATIRTDLSETFATAVAPGQGR